MIVVDTSVWIDFLRRVRTPQTETLVANMRPVNMMIGEPILLEVLQGARDDRHAAALEGDLRLFLVEGMLNPDIAVRAAANYRSLRVKGITIRKTIDVVIATYCIENGHQLLHDDRDFEHFRPLGLLEA
jgi:predicted nucleic acid-binding protein